MFIAIGAWGKGEKKVQKSKLKVAHVDSWSYCFIKNQ